MYIHNLLSRKTEATHNYLLFFHFKTMLVIVGRGRCKIMLAHVRSTTPGSEDVTVRYVIVVYLLPFFQLHESPILCLFSKTTHRRTLCCTRRLKGQLIGYHTQQSVNCFLYALIKIRCCYSSTMLFTQQPVLGLMQVIYTNTVMMHNSEIISFYSMAVLALGASVCLLLVYKSYLC